MRLLAFFASSMNKHNKKTLWVGVLSFFRRCERVVSVLQSSL